MNNFIIKFMINRIKKIRHNKMVKRWSQLRM